MRTGYSVSKVVAFSGLALVHALGGFEPAPASEGALADFLEVLRVVAWIAVGFCVFRGIPVIVRAVRNNLFGEMRTER
jgi:hypothetical protein